MTAGVEAVTGIPPSRGRPGGSSVEHTPAGFGRGARRLAVHRRGAGAPVVYLHGLGGSHRYFEALWEALPPHQVIAPDLLGFGRSAKPRRCAYGVEDQLAALGPVVPPGALLVGHSAGAIIAAALAARAEVPPRGVILIGLPVFASPSEALACIGGLGPLARSTAQGRPSAHAACVTACMARPLWRLVAPHLRRDLPRPVVADTFSHVWRSYSRSLRSVVVDHRVSADLDDLSCPLLLIHGDQDRSAPLAAVRTLAGGRPETHLVVEPGDHHLPVRRPEAVARHLAPLLRSPRHLGGGASSMTVAARQPAGPPLERETVDDAAVSAPAGLPGADSLCQPHRDGSRRHRASAVARSQRERGEAR